ncbi:MAG: (Fe-S)-binding protein, partial [Anaerolineales bacterium]|nr:(Fe-S)-binding protein [Anaerolineales bacterium]
MLTTPEKIAFILLLAAFGAWAAWGFYHLYRAVRRGRPVGPLGAGWPGRAGRALLEVGLQVPMFKARPVLTAFHALIFFGFSYYFLVNANDLLEGFWPGYETATTASGLIGILNLLGDLLSAAVLLGVVVFLVRRFITRDPRLAARDDVRLLAAVKRGGIRRDSLIVGGFILAHVGSRFLGQALRLAQAEVFNPLQPLASLAALPLRGAADPALTVGIHVAWWLAIGMIVVFLPYFVISKHLHIMAAPLNLALASPGPRGRLEPAVPKGAPAETAPGAASLADLAWPRLLDAYACIMCNRCQDVCPAYNSQRPLSPAALEINKRYWLNGNLTRFAAGADSPALLEFAISPEAAWACTTCYACVRVCPVGNAPMADIVDLRRRMV